jgi:peptidoglycan/LPS O-acetylase OafA/YrhL
VIKVDRIYSFSSLRLISCALVFVAHGLFHSRPSDILEQHFHFGQLGVDIFFVLSGFLITRILLADKSNGSPWHYFVARRSLRILPAWLLLLIAMSLLLPWLEKVRPDTWTGPIHWSIWTYIFNYAPMIWPGDVFDGARLDHLWTLCVEEHYYLLWPIVVYTLRREQSRKVLLTIIPAIVAVSVYYYVHRGNTQGLYLSTNVRGISLAIGSLMAYHEGWCRSAPARLPAGGLIFAGFLLGADSALTATAPVLLMDILLSTGITLLFLAAIEPFTARRWISWTRNKYLEVLGTMTYGLYLFHWPIFQWFNVATTGLSHSVEAIIVTVVLATISYNAVERPFIDLGKRFRASRPVMPAAPAAALSVH